MSKRYGLPYMGSKNQIAEWVVAQLPSAENFYDLFCGGTDNRTKKQEKIFIPKKQYKAEQPPKSLLDLLER